MWLVVGLGNPGPNYRHNRHNVGFGVVDGLATAARAGWRTAPDSVWCQISLASTPARLLKPHTFMNRSGQVVAPVAADLGISVAQILVIHDDVDLPLGTLRLKAGGGHGGHNGLRSLMEELEDPGFLRVRLGIGRPADGDVVGWVLGNFGPQELDVLAALGKHAQDAIRALLTHGLAKAASTFNARKRGS